MDHGYVVQTRRLKAYFDEHGVGPVPPSELDARVAQATALEKKYSLAGDTYRFREAYGWALTLMPLTAKGNRTRPTMDQLEKLADLDHRRLLVTSSHGIVHADSGGIAGTVLLGDGLWLAGPTERFIEAVARPTLGILIHMVAATHPVLRMNSMSLQRNSHYSQVGSCPCAVMPFQHLIGPFN